MQTTHAKWFVGRLFVGGILAWGPAAWPQVSLQDSIDGSDPVIYQSPDRTATPSSCPSNGPYSETPDVRGHHSKTYHFWGTGPQVLCVQVSLTATGCPDGLYSQAYHVSGPGCSLSGLTGQMGNADAYTFSSGSGCSFDVVVYETVPDAGCSNYTMSLFGTGGGIIELRTPTPTPPGNFTPTFTPTPQSPTETPTAQSPTEMITPQSPTETPTLQSLTATPTSPPPQAPAGSFASGALLLALLLALSSSRRKRIELIR